MADKDETNPRQYPTRPYVGVGVVIFRGDEVLLAQRGKWPRRGTWSIPGGAQELGETVHDAGRREIREETGLEIDIIGLIDVVDAITHDAAGAVEFHYTLVDLAAEWRSGEARALDDVAGVRWVAIDAIDEYQLRPATRQVILDARKLRAKPLPY